MKVTEQTHQQIERFIGKIADKFPTSDDISLLTDIHIRVSPDSGELLAYDDDDREITRCVVDQWIDCKEEKFYDNVTLIMRTELQNLHNLTDNLGILKPYSFILEDDDHNHVAELYVADDDTVIIGGDLMPDLDNDLDNFLKQLLKE